MANNADTDALTSDIRAVARVGQICELFGPRVLELSAADIAERTGLNRTTAYRYCASMVTAGILRRGVRRGTFALGPLMLELGTLALGRQRVVEIAGPYLRKLSAAVRMTAVLSVMGTHGPIVALTEEDTSRMVVVTVHAGTKLDVTAAQTRFFLAYSDDSTMMAEMTEHLSPAERAQLEADIVTARQRGFSFVRPHGGPFVIGAPVFDEGGLAATVGILGAGDVPDLTPAVEQLLATTGALSSELGGTVAPAV
jgi:DNA-binding IclR family transcriptional regulator